MNRNFSIEEVTIVFVLGGPGSGKGTQCLKISQQYLYCHLSAGDLLRAEVKSGSDIGAVIQNIINEGKLVPAEITVKLLQQAMRQSGRYKFLIDGFPRNEENLAEWESAGRTDDTTDTIRKRVELFYEESLPVIEDYASKGKLRKIDAERSMEEVFEQITEVFTTHEKGKIAS